MTIVIDTEIIKKENLTLIDSIVLSFIISFKQNGYFGKIEFIAENLNLGRATIFKSLNKLRKLNLIYKKQNTYYAKFDLLSKTKKQSTIETQQSTIETQQSTIETQQSTIETQQSTIETQQSTIEAPYPYYNKEYNKSYNKEDNKLYTQDFEKERESIANLFEKFWEKYPKKANKAQCKLFFERNKELIYQNQELILSSLECHINSDQWTRDNQRWIPYPFKWLKEHQWELDLKEAKRNVHKDGAFNEDWLDDYLKELEGVK